MVKAGHMDANYEIFDLRKAEEQAEQQAEQLAESKAKKAKRSEKPGESFWRFAVAFVVGAVDFVFLMTVFC